MSWSGPKHQSAQTRQRNQEESLTPDKLILDENGEAYADLIVHDASIAVTFNDATTKHIVKCSHEYKDALARIVRRVAAEGGWTDAEITSANATVHINTSMNHPNVRNPTRLADLLNDRLYPKGFPYHLLTGRSGNNFNSDDEAGGGGSAGKGGSSGNPPSGSGSGASGSADQRRGAASGKSHANNPFDVLGETGPTDAQGHATYYGDVMVKGKMWTTLVSVVPAGISHEKGGLFFCWHFGDDQHSCFATPPAVSKKDPRQARAARLPYIEGIDKKDPGRHLDVQYSQKEKQYYVKPNNEEIWLKEVR
ncbi:hypothetical protein BT67DRAFT_431499 [Trichocladium antarcticum]|uniref:Uncharacterized protein n=1 Tax=Trichocladium antarcticum TaxID=1450529 RepID=A0AAN6UQB7_9PEZI|nr:hypothetical protein BT67DRAFT_431499 [Trichocladium antarcticum]